MENQIAVAQPQQPVVMPAFSLDQEDVKRYIAPNATDKELFMFMEICKSYGLNPFKREVYFVKYGDKPGETIVGYEMYLKRAEGTGLLDGWEVKLSKDDIGEMAVITIYRKDQKRPFVWTVYRKEFDKNQANWKSMPLFMLRKVAISQGFRLAFPSELGGMPYIPEEISGSRSDDLPQGDAREAGEASKRFTAPAGMDDMPPTPSAVLPIDPEKLAGFIAGIDSLAELEDEWRNPGFQARRAVSGEADQAKIDQIFAARHAALEQREAA